MGEFSAVPRFRTRVISFHRSTLGSVRGFFDRTFYVAYTDTFLRVPNATRMLENGGVGLGLTWAVLEEVKLVEGRQKRETRL